MQKKALSLGFVQCLLRLLTIETDETLTSRLLFNLSTLLRNFPVAQAQFLEHGGAELMVTIIGRPNTSNRIAVRAITLMNDLIVEKVRRRGSSIGDHRPFIVRRTERRTINDTSTKRKANSQGYANLSRMVVSFEHGISRLF